MKERKSGLKRRLAAYFGISFLLPAAAAFYILYHFVATEFGIEVRERSVAVEKMIRLERSYAPDPARAAIYGELYEKFRDELKRRGYT